MQHCPYCNIVFDENLLDDVMFVNSLRQLSDSMPKLSGNETKEFYIDQLKVVIKGNNYIFSYILNFLGGLRNYLKSSIRNYISDNHFNTIVKKGEGYVETLLNDSVN